MGTRRRSLRLTQRGTVVVALFTAAVVVAGGLAVTREPAQPVPDPDPYRGSGTWIDVFDFTPDAGQRTGAAVTPDDLDLAAVSGVRTVFLQGASADGLLDAELLAAFLERAHQARLQVVAWYVPTFADVDEDLRRLVALHRFAHRGQRFDGLAVDIEFTDAVPDHAERNRRLVDLSQRLRTAVGDAQLGAIVPPPVLLEQVNPDLWRRFPWQELAGIYDVWLPMSYWTERRVSSGFRNPVRYTTTNVERLRLLVGDPAAAVHPIGGLAGDVADGDYRRFVDAAEAVGSVGMSLYDFSTTPATGLAALRRDAVEHPGG